MFFSLRCVVFTVGTPVFPTLGPPFFPRHFFARPHHLGGDSSVAGWARLPLHAGYLHPRTDRRMEEDHGCCPRQGKTTRTAYYAAPKRAGTVVCIIWMLLVGIFTQTDKDLTF